MENEVLQAFEEIKAATGSLSEAVAQLRESKDRQLADLPTADSLMAKMAPELKAMIDEAVEAKAARPAVDDTVKTAYTFGDLCKDLYAHKALKGPVPDMLTKDQSTATTAGGYLVPDEFRPQLLEIPMEQGVVRPRAQVIPMGSDTLNIPAWNQETHAANFYGGVLAYWTGEGSAITASAAAFLNVALGVNELAALNYVSDKLMKASPMAVGQYLAKAFGNAIRFQEDEKFFTGDGNGCPTGFIGSACEIADARAGAGAISTADVISMFSQQLGSNPVWVANKTTIPQLFMLDDGEDSNIWCPSAVPGIPGTLLGCPVIFTEHASALGTKGDLALCDFGYYLIGDLGTLAIDYSEHYRFANVQGAMRLVEYVDGKPWMASTYTPHKGTALSPFVVLN
jgi:HK97 family phage major capsid protein